MKVYCFLFIIVSLHILVKALIPSLSVKRLDKTLIARKRQDTMDMCRIFTEENEKGHHNHAPRIIKTYRSIIKHRYKRDIAVNEESIEENQRYKRGATMKYAVNPALNPEDSRRVESIVEKLYDDLEEKGQRITYRQVQTTNSVKVNTNKTFQPSRRFDFAPAIISGPQTHINNPKIPVDTPFDSRAKWRHGIVPYFIDSKTYDAHLSEVIMKAFDYFEKATCIRLQKLREKPTDKQSLEKVAWVYISNPTGIRQCVHTNERLRIDGVQMTVFGYDCMSLGDIVHEVMHILGYSHEHLRSDRDQHISILWDNIKPGYKKYFDLNADFVAGIEYDLDNLPYDYTSILHYPPRAFSKNGKATILTEPGIKIGQREGLSEIDVEKVALIYSNECVSRNREYLLKTCPSVVKSVTKPTNISQTEIKDYFKDRLWQFGIINYKLRDKVEFSVEERENINAVFRHIEEETCLQFKDVGASDDDDEASDNKGEPEKDDNDSEDSNHNPNNGTSETDVNIFGPKDDTPRSDVVISEPEVGTTETVVIIESQPDTSGSKSNDIGGTKRPNIVVIRPTISDAKKVSDDFDKTELRENEIQRSDGENLISVARTREKNIKRMDITMKKALLRKAIAKRMKNKSRRRRRNTNSVPPGTRRHANAILVLKRSPASDCKCPEPGSPKGENLLEISAGCFNSVNDLLHFFIHVLGLDHQHNMHDRDNYLHIVWKNLTADVREEMKEKLPPAASVGFQYDYQSVMHYPWLQIKNGKTNIMYPIWNDGWAMGHWQGLSSVDVQKLNLLYINECKERREHEKQ